MTVDSSQDAQPAHASALLAVRGAVPADGLDTGVAAHYGDPLREQRAAERGAALVDRSHRGVLRLTGPDRLSWLHSLTSQHLTALPAMRGSEALLLSPHGHVEHHLLVADDGEATLLDVEPGTVSALLDFLTRMRFMLRVELADVSGELAVLSVIGPEALAAVDAALGTGLRAEAGPYPLVRGGDGVLARAMPYGADLLVPRPTLDEVAGRLQAAGAALAGISAFEARRVVDRRPRLGIDTDHRTIPHEVGWLATAVHLDKGCYRGQETVARVQNLGRPPRRMVMLHLDGSAVAATSPVAFGPRTVGFVGTSVNHHELGPVALAVLKRNVPDDAVLSVTDADPAATRPVAASIDPDPGPVAPTRPAGHLRT